MIKIKNLNLLEEGKEYNQEYVYITLNINEPHIKLNTLTFKEYIDCKEYRYDLNIEIIDNEFFVNFNNKKYINLLINLLDRLYNYSLINNKEDMLNFCNKEGKYIDSKYYNLKDINDCANYIIDCEDNYCDKFMYQTPRLSIDYYDEDYYIKYHFSKVGYDMFNKEDFWLLLKNKQLNIDNLNSSEFLEYDDLLKILFTFKEQDTSEYLGNFLIQTSYDEWESIDKLENAWDIKDEQDKKIEYFIKTRLKEKLENKLPNKNITEKKTKI